MAFYFCSPLDAQLSLVAPRNCLSSSGHTPETISADGLDHVRVVVGSAYAYVLPIMIKLHLSWEYNSREVVANCWQRFRCKMLKKSAYETSMDSQHEEMALSPVQPFSGRRVQRISRLANKKNKFINPKMKIKLGNWNVRTLNQEGKLEQLTSVFDKYSLDMCALTETRLTGFEKRELDEGKILLHSGREDGSHYQGVGLLLNKQAGQALDEWEPVNERIMYARLKSSHGNMSVMVCYAPTNEADDNRKDDFYATLQEAIDKVPKHDMLLCIGDMNAKLGNDNEGFNESMGVHGMGEMNENGLRFASFCMANELVIGSTMFEHKDIHKYTWISPCGRH